MSTPIPNPIKYSTQSQTLSLKTGDHWIGTGDVSKAPTSSTSYWNGMTPPAGGYTVYLGGVDGPAIFCPANDAALIEFTNRLAGTAFTTAQECMAWFIGQPDKSCVNMNYERIVTDGLVFNVDGAFSPSYPMGGTGWFNLRTSAPNGTLINGPTFSTENGGVLRFDGVDDQVRFPGSDPAINISNAITMISWVKPTVLKSGWQGVFLRQTVGQYELWIYDNKLRYGLNTGAGTSRASGSISLFNDIWYMLCWTYDGSIVRLYVNSTPDSTFNRSGSIPASTNTFYVGYSGYATEFFNGNVAICQLYNRALSSQEILQNYQAMFTRFYGADIVMDGLVSHLDAGYSDSYSGSGTTWSDISGYGRNGTLVNGPTYSALGGGSIVFDGTNDFVSYDSALTAQTANLNGYHSVEIWFKADRVNQTNDGLFRSLNPNAASPPFGQYLHYIIRNSKFYMGWYTPNLAGVQTISANTWYQVVFLYGEDKRLRIYVNGALDAVGPVQTSEPYLVGGSFYNGGVGTIQLGYYATYFQGLMSIVRVYNRGLTAAEVLQNFNAQKARFGL